MKGRECVRPLLWSEANSRAVARLGTSMRCRCSRPNYPTTPPQDNTVYMI